MTSGAEHIAVDRDVCISSGTCAAIAPGVFSLDHSGSLTISESAVPAGPEGDPVREAVDSCPVQALQINE